MQHREFQNVIHMWIFIGPDHILERNDYNFAKLLSTILRAGACSWNGLQRD